MTVHLYEVLILLDQEAIFSRMKKFWRILWQAKQ
jgi:hypothetical protein